MGTKGVAFKHKEDTSIRIKETTSKWIIYGRTKKVKKMSNK